MKNKVQKLFSTSQVALYAVILMGIDNVRKYLPQFAEFKAFYTKEYLNNLEILVETAEKMLNEEQRNAITSASRTGAEESAVKALKTWRTLRQYINTAYKGKTLKTRLNEAGISSYADAAQMNWSAVKSILKMGGDFLAANKTTLMAKDNMPADFIKIYNDAATACQSLIKDFRDSSLGKGSQTIDKNQADNELYTTTMAILKDGQHLFENEKSVLRLFVFNTLLKIVKSKMPARFSGYATDSNKRPVEGAVINVNNGQYTAVTDKKGRFEINRMEAAAYPVEVLRTGFHLIEEEITFKPGTGKHIRFVLSAEMQIINKVNNDNGLEKVA